MPVGRFVFTSGRLLVAGTFVFTPLMPLESATLELVAGVLAESLELFGPQPVSANAARTVSAKTGTIDFINFILDGFYRGMPLESLRDLIAPR